MGINIDYYTNYEQIEQLEKYEKFLKDYKDKIDALVERTFKLEGFEVLNVYIGVGIITEEEIKNINNEFRKIDASTDVLSFPIFSKEELENLKKSEKEEEISIGDIVLCMDVIEKNAIKFETGFDREMLYMIVHGICHLLGYDHEDENDKKCMRKMEEMILE